jgi:hypothetical protein
MKAFLHKITYSFLIIAIIYCIYLFVWGLLFPMNKDSNLIFRKKGTLTLKVNDYKSREKIDVLILGSSHAHNGIDTRILEKQGVKSFNFGTNSQTLIQTNYLLQKYLDTNKVKIVAIETNISNFHVDGVESSLDILFNEGINFEIIQMVLSTKNLKGINSLLFVMTSKLFGIKSINMFDDNSVSNYLIGGYTFKDSKKTNTNKATVKNVKLTIRESQENALINIIDFLNANKIEFFFFQAPVTSYRYMSLYNDGFFENMMSKYDIKYINFNGLVDLDDFKDFRDDHHLNQAGVNKFNPVFIDYIKENYNNPLKNN